MSEKRGYRQMSLEQLLLEREAIQSFCEEERVIIVDEVLEKQQKIYDAIDVDTPKAILVRCGRDAK